VWFLNSFQAPILDDIFAFRLFISSVSFEFVLFYPVSFRFVCFLRFCYHVAWCMFSSFSSTCYADISFCLEASFWPALGHSLARLKGSSYRGVLSGRTSTPRPVYYFRSRPSGGAGAGGAAHRVLYTTSDHVRAAPLYITSDHVRAGAGGGRGGVPRARARLACRGGIPAGYS
jgi:hypothetical protein